MRGAVPCLSADLTTPSSRSCPSTYMVLRCTALRNPRRNSQRLAVVREIFQGVAGEEEEEKEQAGDGEEDDDDEEDDDEEGGGQSSERCGVKIAVAVSMKSQRRRSAVGVVSRKEGTVSLVNKPTERPMQ